MDFPAISRIFATKRIPEEVNQALPGAVSRRYQVFDENQSPTIFDVEEERARVLEEEEMEITGPDPYEGIDLSRGKTGVFEIEDLVELLRKEKGKDIFVCQLSPELKYVDYLCVATALSTRHMRGLAEFVRKVYKMKRHPEDKIPKIEGETCRDWIAMDMGNIALHIFSAQARKLYDLESLWTLGPEYDAECNKPIDPQHFHLMQLLGQNTTNLGVSK
uniref:Mitochondrial assembly of ribosomal large subunit protein 1 n=1 Tax=Lutzomyia longipalpis TaxID=7200 RepID=A0A1B0CTG2_LUTLO